jgi:hypothetical protein
MTENGVWRTIMGRRIFIAEGQSLDDAIKKSGKKAPLKKSSGATKKLSVDDKIAKLEKDLRTEGKIMGLKPRIEAQREIDRLEAEKKGKTYEELVEERRKEKEERERKYDEEETRKKKEIEDNKKERASKSGTTEEEVNDWLGDNRFKETDDIDQAIFIFPDGKMIDGEFYGGNRGLDHNSLTSIEELPNFKRGDSHSVWPDIHYNTGVVRLVPETKVALIMEGQTLTPAVKKQLQDAGYEIEPYVKNPFD